MLLTRILLLLLSIFACFGLAVGKGVSRDTNAEHSPALHFLYLHGEHVGLKTSSAVAGDITTYQTALVQQMGVLTDCLEWASEEGWFDADPGDIAGAIYARSMFNELSGNEYNWEVTDVLEAFGDLSDADAEFLYNLDNVIRVEDIIPPSNLVGCNSFSEFGCSNLDPGVAVLFPMEDFSFLGDIKAVWEAAVICRNDPLSASCSAASAAAAVGLIVPGKLPVKAGTKAGDDITDAVDDALRTGGGSAPNRVPQIALNRQNGAAFENQVVDALSHVGGAKNGVPVTVTLPSGKQVTTIPDLWGRNTGGILEVKNVENLSNSNQLRAQLQLAEETGTPFNLVVSPRTQNISGPLRDRIDEVTRKVGGGVYRYDPSTGKLSNF